VLVLVVRVRLTRKLAEEIDGIDLSAHRVGEVFDIPGEEAALLIAERWAEPVRARRRSLVKERSTATDGSRRRRKRKAPR
jgi:hypothetical protein